MPAPNNLIDIPINIGTRPDWETRLGYPQLKNMFVGKSGSLYPTPGLTLLTDFTNFGQIRATHYTIYNSGAYFVVTTAGIYRAGLNGSQTFVASIASTGLPVKIDENLQNQITIVDGANVYVIDQVNASFTILGSAQGYTLTQPVSVIVLNTFTIILSKTGVFQVSNADTALVYNALQYGQIESVLTQGVDLATMDNNLYIFGTNGIERWEPTFTNDYLFPFQRDSNFRSDFGAISTGAVMRGIDQIYFLSQKFTPMTLKPDGIFELTALDQSRQDNEDVIGISKIISQYSDVAQCEGNFFSFRGNFFFQMTFPTTGIAWQWCENSTTWSTNDDLIVATLPDNEVVGTLTGLYTLSLVPSYKRRTFIPQRITDYRGQQSWRMTANGFEMRIVQGFEQPIEPQFLELSLSLDSLTYSNVVKMPLGLTGERQAIVQWCCNIACQEITPKFEYFGNLNFVIEKVTMTVN